MNHVDSLQLELDRHRRRSLWVGGSALALCAAGAHFNVIQFFRSYLIAYLFWIGVALGCMAILMLHHMVGGTWGFAIRRLLESGTKTLPLMAALFIPLPFGLTQLYKWAAEKNSLSGFKALYLNTSFFYGRTAAYFAAWIILAHFLSKWSQDQDETGETGLTWRLQSLSGPGLLVYGLTVTFASVDWVMSLEPRWFSTIYGMIFMVTQALAAMAFVTVVVTMLADRKPLSDIISPMLLNDFGNLLLTFTMLWAYLSYSQYVIIWSGNLQDEVPWYVTRAHGGWAWVALFLIVFHFAVPFLLLLSRTVKRRREVLAVVAAGLVVMSLVDVFWLTAPVFDPAGPEFHWMDWLAVIGIGGIWVWGFISHLRGKPLLPLHDPRLEGALLHG